MTREPPRLLAARSELGYVHRPDRALPQEPEAVPAGYQRELTRRAQRAKGDRDRDAWLRSRDLILIGVRSAGDAHLDADVTSELRAIARLVERISRRVA